MCLEMQGVHGFGKRKRAVVVHRSTDGEYSTIAADPRPGDEHSELHPTPVPRRIDVEPLVGGAVSASGSGASESGVRQVTR